MGIRFKKPSIAIVQYLKKLLFQRSKTSPPIEKIQTKTKITISSEKRAELEKLCDQLFQKKKLITSGKFQFIGLTKIRKRLGKQWAGLCKIVYDTAEEVIENYISKGDIFIRYQDDTYVIIFAYASLEEGRAIAAAIAEDIQKRLFELEEDDLKSIEIRNAIRQIRTDFLIDQGFPDFVDTLAVGWENSEPEQVKQEETVELEIINVNSNNYKRNQIAEIEEIGLPENISFSYIPLWNVPRNALNTYLCFPHAVRAENDLMVEHKNFYKKLSVKQKVSLDIQTLQHVMNELNLIEQDGRKLLIGCPVHYETLYRFDNYEVYKKLLEKISEKQKQFLVFMIINMAEGLPPKDPYWFAAPLRAFCRHVFAEVPLRRDINFTYLRNTGVDVVGVRLEKGFGTEQEIINILNGFNVKAKALKIPYTFVLDISSLSLTTSAVCAGFDFLGGKAIHDAVGKPDTIHKFRHEDVISSLSQKN